MKVERETDGFIAPLMTRVGELGDDNSDLLRVQTNPFWFIEEIEDLESCFREYMEKYRSEHNRTGDPRALERERTAAGGWTSALAVILNWKHEDLELAILFAARMGWCSAKLEDLEYEEKLQAKHRSDRGGGRARSMRSRNHDAKVATVRAWMIKACRENPSYQYKVLVTEAAIACEVKEWWIRRYVPLKKLKSFIHRRKNSMAT